MNQHTDTHSATPSPMSPAREGSRTHERSELPDRARTPVLSYVTPKLSYALKSSGGLNDPYGRGKGLSIAAPRNDFPGQTRFPRSVSHLNHGGPLRGHLGVNRGSFNSLPPLLTPRTTQIGRW